MKVAFTGTREGMTIEQVTTFRNIVKELQPTEFHHGNCVGADDDAHTVVGTMSSDFVDDPISCEIHVHPGRFKKNGELTDDTSFEADCEGDVHHEPEGHLDRNRRMVDTCETLIATPATEEEQKRGGTWYTIRYARKQSKCIYTIYPSGIYERDMPGRQIIEALRKEAGDDSSSR